MKHQSFALIDKRDYNAAFDLPYKELVITFESGWGEHGKEYFKYHIEVNHLTQHTGDVDYDTARELFAMAWGGKVRQEDAKLDGANKMRDMIIECLKIWDPAGHRTPGGILHQRIALLKQLKLE